ncbi:hypothetical protein FBEOM_10899 [Fusarium beomiforme]|uniref:Uncharacterized protein n=1 Tax=Fusarium beomiforme TaxID=44412 RepID=A0A9P5DUH0_9HYPO|nr:hypothetical protein FBEOM_10899 [Fusarium beomiforme]
MMHRSALLALGAFSSTATAAWLKSNQERSWEPPRQTGVYGEDAELGQIGMGWSPVPTGAPKLAGAMDMGFALGKRDETDNTCGYNTLGNSFTCTNTLSATCTFSDGYIGCCDTARSCNSVKTTCIPYSRSREDCASLTDFHTLCCGNRDLPSCFEWVATKGTDEFTLFDCAAGNGTSALLLSDPLALTSTSEDVSSTIDNPSTTTDNGSSTTSDAAATSTSSDSSGGGSSTNVGAIAGGTVGGVAALALVGLAGFLLFRRRNKTTPAAPNDGTQNQPPMAQGPQSPGPSFVPSSPSNAAYPSGVPSNFQGGYQQAYDPSLAAPYGQPQGYQQPGYSGYSPQPQNFQGRYPQQGFAQQSQYPSQYGVGGYGAPSTSPPPHMTPSPGPNKDGVDNTPQQHVQELPAVQPLGNEGNRAELS